MRLPLTHGRRGIALSLAVLAAGVVAWGLTLPSAGAISQGFQPLAATLLVVGLAFLATWGIGQLSLRVQGGELASPMLIHVRGVRPLGQGKALLVVDVDGERFLLCSGKDRVELLARLSRNQAEHKERGQEEPT